MAKYTYKPSEKNPEKFAKARGSHLRVHYKNTHETAMAIKGMKLKKAQAYLKRVIEHKDAIPFLRHCGNAGRHAQGMRFKESSGGQSRWPEKSCRFLLDLLKNAESNAEVQGLETKSLTVAHMQIQRAPKMRRRTYRAHGRIGPYQSSPCHLELVLAAPAEKVAAAPADLAPRRKRVTRMLAAGATAATL